MQGANRKFLKIYVLFSHFTIEYPVKICYTEFIALLYPESGQEGGERIGNFT